MALLGLARGKLAGVLIALAGVLLSAGVPALYVSRELLNEPHLQGRLATVLHSRHVRRVAAEHVVDGFADAGVHEVFTVRPLLVPAIGAFLDSPPFQLAVRAAARDAHNVIVNQHDESLILDIGEGGVRVASALRSVSPAVARAIPPGVSPPVIELDAGAPALSTVRRIAGLRSLGVWSPLAALVLMAAGIAVAPRRRDAIVWAGVAVAITGAVIVVLLAIGRAVTTRKIGVDLISDQDARGAAQIVWDALVGDLSSWGAAMVLAGGAVAVAAQAVGAPEALAARIRATLSALKRTPSTPALRAARAVVVVAAGALAVFAPAVAVNVLVVPIGAFAVLLGLAELSAMLNASDGKTPGTRRALGRRGKGVLVAAALAVVCGAAAAAEIVVGDGHGATLAEPTPREGCLGSKALCALRLNEVAFPATHNSFSAAAERGWVFPNQRYGIERQLRDGIRGFLLDFHVGVRDGADVRTVLRDEAERNLVAKAIGHDSIAVAERLVGRLGVGDIAGDKDVYMCHSLCELGAESAVAQLSILTRYLRRNPGEVLVMYVEPYVTPAQIQDVFDKAGLLHYVAELKRDEPLPTLGEMVNADKRVVVLAERDGGTLPWYLEGFSFSQDTPLGVTKPSQLSCARARGDNDSPLLTVNHWVDAFPPPPRGNIAFGGKVLTDRLAKCARERAQMPNIIAVDFYEHSGVVEATDALNRAALRR